METNAHRLHHWGLTGGLIALTFAIWMLFFPDAVEPYFAWNVHPRLAQVFIGAGYIFRTGFFFAFWRERAWHRLRWAFWGNLVFTGTLLLATLWHIEDFGWFKPVAIVLAHLWLLLYVSEPVAMAFSAPRGPASKVTPVKSGPILPGLKFLLVTEVALMGTFGALLVINPEFLATRWMWSLVDNPLDARIIAAWFLGWATWAGAMAFAEDWDDIRIGVQLNILFGLALVGTLIAFAPLFDLSSRQTAAYAVVTPVLTAGLIFFYWRQERARRRIAVQQPAEARGGAR
jgi:hypothetical protein